MYEIVYICAPFSSELGTLLIFRDFARISVPQPDRLLVLSRDISALNRVGDAARDLSDVLVATDWAISHLCCVKRCSLFVEDRAVMSLMPFLTLL